MLFVACEVGFRRTLGIATGHVRLAASVAVLATVPVGTGLAAAAQVGALAADGILIATPEYNVSMPGQLKNALK